MGLKEFIEKKREKQALYEVDVVRQCVAGVEKKSSMNAESCARIEKEIEELITEIIRLDDAGESAYNINILLSQKKAKESMLYTTQMMTELYLAVYQPLLELFTLANNILEMGPDWHKYLIRKIPEKKLDRMLTSRNSEDMQKVIDLTAGICKSLYDCITSRIRDKVKAEELINRIKETAATQASIYRRSKVPCSDTAVAVTDSVTRSAVASEVEKLRQARSAGMVMPVNVVNNEEASEKKSAKA